MASPDDAAYPVPANHSSEQLAALLEISHLLTSALDLDHVLDLILQSATRLMRAEGSSLLLVDPTTNELVFKVPFGPGIEQCKTVRLKPEQGIAGWVVKQRQALLVNDVPNDPRFYSKIDALTGFHTQSILAVPVHDCDRVIGVIEVLNTSKDRKFEQQDLGLLAAFAAHASVAIRNAQLISTMREENRYLHATLGERYQTLIGESLPMQEAVQIARTAARTDVTILLLGETGVGKEIVARSIHSWSPRASKPFVAVNCVALSDRLLESELFGHEKGAFTGALQQKKGLFELAQGGTIFLDEVGDMEPDLQAKLLRVLQDHEFWRVGGTHPIRVDLRLLAATNQDLMEAMQAKRFRKDLFYRLNVVTITLPPLRERKEDIPALAQFFVQRYCRELKRPLMRLLPEALDRLQQHHWPGNVRELENVIERVVVLLPGSDIRPGDLVLDLNVPESQSAQSLLDLPFHTSMGEHKRTLILYAVRKAEGNKTRAAELLKLQPTYLFRLCRELDIH